MDEQLVYLNPQKILADDNARFSLKKTRIDSLKASILEVGAVLVPVEVEPLEPIVQGCTHRLTAGFQRLAAVLALNAEQNAGLTIPAIVRDLPDDKTRLLHQITENLERDNLSPMDRAIAIKKLFDNGVERGEIRRIFSAAGGRKGNTVQPMSNSMVNISLRLLELPKAIQEKIHNGLVGLAAAYELGKVPPEKRQAVLDRAETDRIAQVDREDKDEKRYIEAEQKVAQSELQEAEALSAAEQAKKDIIDAEKLVAERTKRFAQLNNAIKVMETPVQKEQVEEMKAAEVDLKAAQKTSKDAKNRAAKALDKAKTAAETAEENKAKLEAARKAVKPKKVGPGDVQKAAKSVGATPGAVPMKLSDFRVMLLKDMTKDSVPAKVRLIADAVRYCLDGGGTTKELIHTLAVITGEVEGELPAGHGGNGKPTFVKTAPPVAAKPPAKVMPVAPAVKQGPAIGQKVGKAQ